MKQKDEKHKSVQFIKNKTKKNFIKPALFTIGAESHPHRGTIFTSVRHSGGQNLCVEWGSIFFKTIQEETNTSVMNLEISQ